METVGNVLLITSYLLKTVRLCSTCRALKLDKRLLSDFRNDRNNSKIKICVKAVT